MLLMGAARRKAFAARFGDRARIEDFPEHQAREWQELHENQFNSGVWRFVSLVFMLYHYPGLIVSALFRRNVLHPAVMFLTSAIVWIGLLFLLLRP
jgi:hypothetical protein